MVVLVVGGVLVGVDAGMIVVVVGGGGQDATHLIEAEDLVHDEKDVLAIL